MKLAEITIIIHCPDDWEDAEVESALEIIDDLESTIQEVTDLIYESPKCSGCRVEIRQ
jgi:hypothetical protein